MLTKSWIVPHGGVAGGLTSSCIVDVTPAGVASGADVTVVNVKFCKASDFAPWLWVVLALFVPDDVVKSVASSNPRICVGSDRAPVTNARSLAGAAPSDPTPQAARPIAKVVAAPRSAKVWVFVLP